MLSIEDLKAALAVIPVISFHGFTYRVIADRHRSSPLSATGALKIGGRYNPPGSFEVLYTADSQVTALQEVEALFRDSRGRLRGRPRSPDLLLSIRCDLDRVADLRDENIRRQLGFTHAALVSEIPSRHLANARGEHTPTQTLGSACFESGRISALAAPSAAAPDGFCINIFPQRLSEQEHVSVHDALNKT